MSGQEVAVPDAGELGGLSQRQLEERLRDLRTAAWAVRDELERRRLANQYRHAGRRSRRSLAARSGNAEECGIGGAQHGG